MGYFTHIATAVDGPEAHILNITDLEILTTDSGDRIYSAGGRDGGVLVRDSSLALVDSAPYPLAVGLGADAKFTALTLDGQTALLVSGPANDSLLGYWLDERGDITGQFELTGMRLDALTAIEAIQINDSLFLYTSGRLASGITTWHLQSNNQLVQTDHFNLALQDDANDIFALEHIQIGTTHFLATVSADGNGLYNHIINADGTATLVDYVDMTNGLAVNIPTKLAKVTAYDKTYLLVGAAGTSSITVVAVNANGALVPTDQVNDDRNSRFQSLSVLETVMLDDRAYVIAGGADDGLSLLTLLPNGRLLHLQSLPDTVLTALSNPQALAIKVQNSLIDLYSTGHTDNALGSSGIDHFVIDPYLGTGAGNTYYANTSSSIQGSSGADLIVGGTASQYLSGAAGADIVMDGTGSDTLSGGTGADIFVIQSDGMLDQITDFELGVDQIDLSQMGWFYALDSHNYTARKYGGDITLNGETLQIRTSNGTSLDLDDLNAQNLAGLWHVDAANLPQGDQQIIGTDGTDMILGAEGSDFLIGGEGADRLVGHAGDDMLLGGTYDPDFDPQAARVYRLYQTTLDRAPDATGHLGWIKQLLENPGSLKTVARGFVNSPEFRATYGDLKNEDFVTLLYQNVLNRAPDASGLKGWTDILSAGGTREDIVVGFSESPEFKISTAAHALRLSAEGYRSTYYDDVYRLYQATLDRAPDTTGLNAWAEQLAFGAALAEVAIGFTASKEFRITYGNLDDSAFLETLYNNVLDRSADSAGLSGWLETLANGATRGEVVIGFSQSREFRSKTETTLRDWVIEQGTDDVVDGGTGNNVLFGGTWQDSFIFRAEDAGQHTVSDLEAWDELHFLGFGYLDAGDITEHLTQTGADVLFQDADVQVRFINTVLDELDLDTMLLW